MKDKVNDKSEHARLFAEVDAANEIAVEERRKVLDAFQEEYNHSYAMNAADPGAADHDAVDTNPFAASSKGTGGKTGKGAAAAKSSSANATAPAQRDSKQQKAKKDGKKK